MYRAHSLPSRPRPAIVQACWRGRLRKSFSLARLYRTSWPLAAEGSTYITRRIGRAPRCTSSSPERTERRRNIAGAETGPRLRRRLVGCGFRGGRRLQGRSRTAARAAGSKPLLSSGAGATTSRAGSPDRGPTRWRGARTAPPSRQLPTSRTQRGQVLRERRHADAACRAIEDVGCRPGRVAWIKTVVAVRPSRWGPGGQTAVQHRRPLDGTDRRGRRNRWPAAPGAGRTGQEEKAGRRCVRHEHPQVTVLTCSSAKPARTPAPPRRCRRWQAYEAASTTRPLRLERSRRGGRLRTLVHPSGNRAA
jgi:hypothetical protein